MARIAKSPSRMTDSELNSGRPYRVQFSYGTFGLAVRTAKSGLKYYYAVKRVRGRYYKIYVGKCGDITPEKLHAATVRLKAKYEGFGRDNIGRE